MDLVQETFKLLQYKSFQSTDKEIVLVVLFHLRNIVPISFCFDGKYFPGKRFSHFPLLEVENNFSKVKNNFPLKKMECHVFLFIPLHLFSPLLSISPFHFYFLYNFSHIETTKRYLLSPWCFPVKIVYVETNWVSVFIQVYKYQKKLKNTNQHRIHHIVTPSGSKIILVIT